MIAQGKYKAKATSGDFGTANTGTEFVQVTFCLSDGQEHAGDLVSWKGFFTDKTAERTFQSLRYCGCTFPNQDATNLDGIDRNEVQLVVEHEEYQDRETGENKTAVKVAWVNSLVGGIKEEQRMGDAAKKAFAAKMKGLVITSASSKGGGQKSAAAPARNGAAPRRGNAPEPGYPVPEDEEGLPF